MLGVQQRGQRYLRAHGQINTNICRNNMDDVRALAELAVDRNIAIDFHINEAPMLEQDHFEHYEENQTYLRPQDYEKVDELLDWIIERHEGGQRIVNPLSNLHEMKNLMRGEVKQNWNCRAGHNMLIIRVDGTLAPCFPMYSATRQIIVRSDRRLQLPSYTTAPLKIVF